MGVRNFREKPIWQTQTTTTKGKMTKTIRETETGETAECNDREGSSEMLHVFVFPLISSAV